jgi:lauroyl/myristoyl acyltransferase
VDDPAISRSDLSELIAVSVLAPISWLLPQWLWVAAGRAISFAIAGIRPDVTRRRMRRLREALGPGPSDADLLALRVQIMSAYMEERLQILREYRPGGWRPRLRLVGREHLDAARAAGRGAMLMVCPFSYADLVVKKALHDAGFRVSHLSTFSRGFSPNSCHAWQPTRFGMSTLSRLRTRIEDRYLDERIIVPRSGGLGYLRQMEERLRGGGFVSFRAGNVGHRSVEVRLFGGRLALASGAPNLALSVGAPLLPVFVVRRGLATFDVVVEPPLEAAPSPDRRAAIEDQLQRYAVLLESRIRRDPYLWSGWYRLVMDGAAKITGAPATLAGIGGGA